MLAFKRLRGITGDGVEAPGFLPRFGVIGREIAARDVLSASRADQHLALHDARRACDGHVGSLWDRHLVPHHLAGVSVQCNQTAIERADIDAALIDSDAAIDGIAAHINQLGARHFGIIFPELLAGGSIIGLHHRPCGRDVHDAVDNNWRGFLPARGIQIRRPFKTELIDVLIGDLRQR